MNTITRTVSKIILGLIILVMLIEASTKILFRENIIHTLEEVAKKGLESKLTFTDVSISLLKHFPNLSISMDSILIEEGAYQVIQIGGLELQVDIFDIFDGNYTLNKVLVEDAVILVPVDSLGNKHMVKPRQIEHGEIKQGGNKIKFDIPEIEINRTLILAVNDFKKNRIRIFVDSGRFQLKSYDDLLEFKGDAYATLDTMISKGKLTLTDLPILALGTTFRVNTLDRKKLFDGTLGLADARLRAYGVLSPVGNGNMLDITLDGDDGSLDSYISIFPLMQQLKFRQTNPAATMKLKVYQSGYLDPTHFSYIDINFEMSNAKFSRKGLDGVLDSVSLKGTYSNGKLSMPTSSSLVIDHGHLKIAQSFVSLNGSINDFTDPELDLHLDSHIDLSDMMPLMDYPKFRMDGDVYIDMDLNGKLSTMRVQKRTSNKSFVGSIRLEDLYVESSKPKFEIQNLNGELTVNNLLIELKKFNGRYNGSQIAVSGQMDNFLPFIDDQNVNTVLANLDIVIDDLTIPEFEEKGQKQDPTSGLGFSFIPKFLNLGVQVKAGKLRFKDQEIEALSMGIELNSDSILVKKTKFKFNHGYVTLNARSRTKKDGSTDNTLWIKADLKKLNLNKFISADQEKNNFEIPDIKLYTDIQIEELLYKNIQLNDLVLTVDYEDSLLTATRFGCSFPFGHFNTSFALDMHQAPYELKGFSNINLRAFNVDSLRNYFNSLTMSITKKDSTAKKQEKIFDIEKYTVTIQCPQIAYQNYVVSNFSTNLHFRNNRARLNQSHFYMYGGEIDLSGLVYRNESGEIQAYCNLNAEHIDLSKVIDGFAGSNKELFSGQNFKGDVGIEGQVLLKYNKELVHQEDQMVGKIKLKLKDAELIDFKPISESLKFIKQANREQIYLTNPNVEVLFHNSELIIPPTVFQTTLSNIEFTGYHSTDFAFGFDLQVSVSELLFKSQKKKKSSVKKNKKNVKFGSMKYYLSARTVEGEMDINPIKRRVYRKHLEKLHDRHLLVDSVLTAMDREMEN